MVMENAGYDIMEAKADRVAQAMKEKGFKILETEAAVTSSTHLYGGRLDAIAELDGNIYVIDYKSGGSWDAAKITNAFVQLAAYACSDYVREKYGEKVSLCMIPLDTSNKEKLKPPKAEKNVAKCFSAFLRARENMHKQLGI